MKGLFSGLIILLLVGSLIACAVPSPVGVSPAPTDEGDIGVAIRGFYDAYNAQQPMRCTTYLTNVPEEEESGLQADLMVARGLAGTCVIQSIGNVIIAGSKASADVLITLGGETKTKHWDLIKEGSDWKLIWEDK